MGNISEERLTCLVLGAILIFSGIIAYYYEETRSGFLWTTYTVHPYREFAIPLITIGCIFLASAEILRFLEKQQKRKKEKNNEH